MLEIKPQDIVKRLHFDNVWWTEGAKGNVPYSDQPKRKYFLALMDRVLDRTVNRAVVVMGPRRVGKTVMVYQAVDYLIKDGIDASSIMYLSLETPLYTGLSLEHFVNYFQEIFSHRRDAELFIFFDEVQYLKNWEIHLKSLVDSYPKYKFVVTGSAAAALKLKSNESGAGRFTDFVLPPLTFAEYLMFSGKEGELIEQECIEGVLYENAYAAKNINLLNEEFVNYLNYGGYPEAVFSQSVQKDPAQYIKSDIIDKVLLRDLPSLYGISDVQQLNRLFTSLAYNTGLEINLESLSKASGVAKNTIKKYMDYLEAAFLIRRVDRVDKSAKRFERAVCFKVYLTNPSMRAALFGKVDADSEEMGALTETAIYSQWQHSAMTELYYARWNGGEVDIVNFPASHLYPQWIIEVKWSDKAYNKRNELDNCVEFIQKARVTSPIPIVTSRTIADHNVVYRDVRFDFRPASVYAYTLGANILRRNVTPKQLAEVSERNL